MPSSRADDENGASDLDSQSPYPAKPSSSAATPLVATPGSTRSSESSREATEADRRVARQLLSQRGAMQKTGWLLLRTTAPNMTNVLHNAGATGFTVRQLYDFQLDREWFLHAYILLYKWSPYRGRTSRWNPRNDPFGKSSSPSAMEDDSANAGAENLLVCGHAMDNASATHALMMAIMNISESGGGKRHPFQPDRHIVEPFDIGDDVRALKCFLKPFDPVIRAASVCSSKIVRDAHNGAARAQFGGHPELLDEDGKVRSSLLAEELWMYSVYVPGSSNEYVYEIDSMCDEPRVVASRSTQHRNDHLAWATSMRRPLMERISTFREHQTPFLLFALTSDMRNSTQPPKERKTKRRFPQSSMLGLERDLERDPYAESDDEAEEEEELAADELRRIRAVHNYDTFFIEMMKLMASRGDILHIVRHEENYLSSQETSEEEEDDDQL
ncbi:Ubiquitin carboxyl-terminal hydrolase [Gracilaria domingensis]|nr:Ubiquitin carboxyl-terminal hydrolase [Gracilaria domingensis]